MTEKKENPYAEASAVLARWEAPVISIRKKRKRWQGLKGE